MRSGGHNGAQDENDDDGGNIAGPGDSAGPWPELLRTQPPGFIGISGLWRPWEGVDAPSVGRTVYDGAGGCQSRLFLNLGGTIVEFNTNAGGSCTYTVGPQGLYRSSYVGGPRLVGEDFPRPLVCDMTNIT